MLLWLALACKDSSPADDTATPQVQEDPCADDLAALDALRAGTLGAEEGLAQVARGCGWPVALGAGRFAFAAIPRGERAPALAGDHNGWAPAELTLEGSVWWAEATLDAPEGALYKLVWADSSGTAEDWEPDPWSRAWGWDEYGEYSLVRGPGGHLERWFALGQDPLQPRDLHVWVPTGSMTHLLVAHDGQNLFDPEAIWGGWHLQEALGPNTLVVGVHNTSARMDEYTHVQDYIYEAWMGGLGDAYADLIVDELLPLMERAYGTPARVGVMGSSLGGLISLHIAQRHPARFDFAASLSGTLGWGSIGASNETLIERYAAGGYTGVAIYLDSGGGPGEGCVDSDGDGLLDDAWEAADNYCETRQLADLLPEQGWTWEQDLWHWWEPEAPHNEAAWAARVALPVGLFEGL